MFEYKKGNKVRCKKFFKKEFYNFYNGTEYEVLNVYNIYDIETTQKNTFSSSIHIEIKCGKLWHTFNYEYFYKYFYSKKEIRQLKLNKIQKNV